MPLDEYISLDIYDSNDISDATESKTKVIIDTECTIFFLDEQNNNADNDSCSKTASLSNDSSVDSLNVSKINEIHLIELNIPVPKCTKNNKQNYVPTSITIADSIALKKSQCLLRISFDSGAMKTMIHRRPLPASAEPTKLTNTKTMSTLAGKLKTTEVVKLRKIKLPEFDKTKWSTSRKLSSLILLVDTTIVSVMIF